MKIVSCNIRDARADDGPNNWQQRRELCVKIIKDIDADIICFQEMRQNQRDDMSAALPDYASYGLPESADAADTPNAIFWRRSAFTCIDSGGYWLSTKPQRAGSRSWGCETIRLANFVVLQPGQAKPLRIINTHLDDSNQFAREQQARMLANDSIDRRDRELQILCGDMNCDATNPAFEFLTAAGWRDSFAEVMQNSAAQFTYHAFMGANYMGSTCDPTQPPNESQGRIDWIFIRGDATVSAAEIIRNSDNGRFPSDHYFVSTALIL